MDLTPEQRQRIEEEERTRHAEEHYRAQVRAGLNQTANPQPAKKFPMTELLAILLGGALLVGFLFFVRGSSTSAESRQSTSTSESVSSLLPQVRYVPVNVKIATGQVIVKARGHVYYRFQIEPDMKDARVSGRFNASGGQGNDVAAVIADESGYTNWINGHAARAFWSTDGRKTTDSFDIRLRPGSYYFAVSNRFSILTDKQVFLEVDLNYQRRDTN